MLASAFLGAPLARALVGAPFDVADASRVNRLADLERLVAGFERRVMEARGVAEGAADLARRLSAGIETPTVAERDAAVEVLLAAERSFGEALQQLLPKARQNETEARKNAPHLLPPLQRMTALMEEEFLLYMEAARDVRWEVLALQAEDEPPADGPILSTPAEVGDFIQSLRTAP